MGLGTNCFHGLWECHGGLCGLIRGSALSLLLRLHLSLLHFTTILVLYHLAARGAVGAGVNAFRGIYILWHLLLRGAKERLPLLPADSLGGDFAARPSFS